MTERTMQKMMAPLGRRVQNMFARGTVLISKATSMMQTLQVKLLAGETLDGLEHFEPYGFTSRPKPGAEVATLFIDGDRSHGIVLVAADRRYRMQAFEEGEVALFDDQGQSIHLKRAGIVVKGAGLPILIEDTPSLTVKADTKIRFETPLFEVTGLTKTQDLTIGLTGPGVANMSGGTVNFNNVNFAYQGGAVTYSLTSILSNGRRIDGDHVHPETGSTTSIPNP